MAKPKYPRCGAKKRNGEPCLQQAGARTNHVGIGTCWLHGGNTPSHIEAAARREVAEHARSLLGIELVEDPHTVLLKMVYMSNAMVHWLSEQIQAIESRDGTDDGYTERDRQSGLRQLNVYLRAHAEERDRAARVSKMAIDAGVAERLVQVEEAKAMMLARVIQSILDELHLTPEQQAVAPALVRGKLLELDAAPPKRADPEIDYNRRKKFKQEIKQPGTNFIPEDDDDE